MPRACDQWLPIGDVRISSSDRLETTVRLEGSSSWFSGHFEECAVVPGVALLAFAAEMVTRQGRGQGRSLEVSGFFKVRFRRVVFPDESLLVSVSAMPPEPEAELPFDVTCEGDSVAQGILKVREKRAQGYGSGAGDE
jgi:3-hydroxymyristoyl/3-hydroxydecanoyl-(acyl carrier protein) dehydratase